MERAVEHDTGSDGQALRPFRWDKDTPELREQVRKAVADWVLGDDGSGGGAEVTIGGAVELGGVIWNGERFEASMAFPSLPEYVRTARGYVGRVLRDGHPCADLAVQLVSEVVTNSLIHSDSAGPEGIIGVTLSGTLTSATIEVTDAGGKMLPQLRPNGDLDSEGGRGLQLVAALADEWGFRENAAGRVTWFTTTAAAGRTA